MRDVGNGDHEPIATSDTLGVDGIVEVLGGFAVDRDQGEIPQIDAIPAILRPDFRAERGRFGKRCLREDLRKVVLADGDLELDVRGVSIPHQLHHLALGFVVGGWLAGDLDHHDLVERGAPELVLGHHDVLAQSPLGRDHEPHAVLEAQPPHHAMIGARQHGNHFAGRPTVPAGAGALHGDPIPVENGTHGLFGQEQIISALIQFHESVAVGVADHRAGQRAGRHIRPRG